MPVSDEYLKKVDEYILKSKMKRKQEKKKSVAHEYTPEDYGLTAGQIRTEFSDYIAKYNLLPKKN